jgi:hypothetical protein
MQSLRQHVRYGLRLIKPHPGFALVTVLTLAFGIGANTAIFSILDALLLRSLPVWRPDRLVEVAAIYRIGAKVPFPTPLSKNCKATRKFSPAFLDGPVAATTTWKLMEHCLATACAESRETTTVVWALPLF